jgi:peptide/nickel transport system ATP-binding protein
MSDVVLSVQGLETAFATRTGSFKAVDGVSFDVRRGQIVGLVGESGSGKSVTGYSILGLIEPPGRIAGGRVTLEGENLLALPPDKMRRMRGARVAMVFQDPMMTLNPVLKIGTQMVAAVRAHDRVSKAEARARARDALGTVGIPSPEERLDAYPHQLSGGMRQRVAIATALLHRPAVIIADEPTTALDVSIQGQILAEVRRLADETGTAFVWITHDLAVVSSLADEVCVMYAGRIVERGPAEAVIAAPRHPYTQGLLASVPSLHEPGERLPQVPGSAPPPTDRPPGCAFRPRCPRATEACLVDPAIQTYDSERRAALCHHPIEPDAWNTSSISTASRSAS